MVRGRVLSRDERWSGEGFSVEMRDGQREGWSEGGFSVEMRDGQREGSQWGSFQQKRSCLIAYQ